MNRSPIRVAARPRLVVQPITTTAVSEQDRWGQARRHFISRTAFIAWQRTNNNQLARPRSWWQRLRHLCLMSADHQWKRWFF